MLLLSGFAIVAVAVVTLFLQHEPEPVYNGKKLSIWLAQGANGFDEGADAFLRSNTVIVTRYLVTSLRKRYDVYWKTYSRLQGSVPATVSRHLPVWIEPKFVRVGATYWLAQLGNEAELSLPELRNAAFRDPAPEVRSSAIWALGRVDHGSEESIALLVNALTKEKASTIRREAAGVLEVWAPQNPEVIQAFIIALKDSDVLVQQIAAAALGAYGARASAAFEPLKVMATNDSPASDYAVRALTEIQKAVPR